MTLGPAYPKSLTPEQVATLLHFVFNPETNMLEADRSIMTILSSILLGDGYRISSSANELVVTDLRTNIDYYYPKTGLKDQSILANQDVTGLVPLATAVMGDDLQTIEANGPEDTSGAVGYEGSNIVPFDVAVIGIEYTFEETIDPSDFLFYEIFEGTDDTGRLIYQQTRTDLTFSPGGTFQWFFTTPLFGVTGQQIYTRQSIAKGNQDADRAVLQVRRSSTMPTRHWVKSSFRLFANQSLVLNYSNSGSGEGIAIGKDVNNLPLKSLVAGDGISLEPTADEIEIISIFGTQYQFEADETESTTTSTTFQTKLTLTTPVLPAGNYRGAATYEVTNDSGDKPVITQTTLDGVEYGQSSFAPKFEDEYIIKSSFAVQALDNDTHELVLSFRSTSEGGTAKIRRARLEIFRVS
ncbi:MAG: hypothetical protein MJK15_03260 [Colwellia sp.]|nr:hypothetical protein [Colwellia sp.]